jgi:dTDP-4-dehydrorhamnose reductase
MRALVTGSNGTVGNVLCHKLARAGWGLVRWDRSEVSIDHYESMEAFVRRERPDVLFHLAAASQPAEQQPSGPEESWRVNYQWTSELAWITRELGIGFVFTSTVMVFTDARPGPYTIASRPDATHDYGMEKRRAEERVFEQNPEAKVARLGWQIGGDLRGNQMAAWLAQRAQVRASARWIPACSFIEDTADALLWIAGARPGLYHVDSNEGWSFYDLACALRRRHEAQWSIEPTWAWAYDQRLLDGRIAMPKLAERLPELRR